MNQVRRLSTTNGSDVGSHLGFVILTRYWLYEVDIFIGRRGSLRCDSFRAERRVGGVGSWYILNSVLNSSRQKRAQTFHRQRCRKYFSPAPASSTNSNSRTEPSLFPSSTNFSTGTMNRGKGYNPDLPGSDEFDDRDDPNNQINEFDDSAAKILQDRLEADKQLALARSKATSFPDGPANFKVKAGNYQWNFHRDIVVAKSEYFKMMTASQFAVSLTSEISTAANGIQEANECVVNLSTDEPELLARLFIWCYCGKYTVGIDAEAADGAKTVLEAFREGWQGDEKDFREPRYAETAAKLHLKMLVASDYYMVPELEKYCMVKLERALWEDADEFMSCLEGLNEVELPNETVDKVLECMVRQSSNNFFSDEQKAKIREARKRFPKLKEAQFSSGVSTARVHW